MPSLTMVGYGIVGLILIGYFGWLCVEMSGHSVSGGGSIAAIFGGAAAGVLAAAVGMRVGDSHRDH